MNQIKIRLISDDTVSIQFVDIHSLCLRQARFQQVQLILA